MDRDVGVWLYSETLPPVTGIPNVLQPWAMPAQLGKLHMTAGSSASRSSDSRRSPTGPRRRHDVAVRLASAAARQQTGRAWRTGCCIVEIATPRPVPRRRAPPGVVGHRERRVAHDVPVVLAGDPGLVAQVRGRHQRQQRRLEPAPSPGRPGRQDRRLQALSMPVAASGGCRWALVGHGRGGTSMISSSPQKTSRFLRSVTSPTTVASTSNAW